MLNRRSFLGVVGSAAVTAAGFGQLLNSCKAAGPSVKQEADNLYKAQIRTAPDGTDCVMFWDGHKQFRLECEDRIVHFSTLQDAHTPELQELPQVEMHKLLNEVWNDKIRKGISPAPVW